MGPVGAAAARSDSASGWPVDRSPHGVERDVLADSPWRDVTPSFGNWKTVYNRHRRWSADGTWEAVLRELQRGCDVGKGSWMVAIDSTVVRAQHAAGARHRPPADVPAQVLAVALAEDLAATIASEEHAVAVREEVTGGGTESHESSTATGETA